MWLLRRKTVDTKATGEVLPPTTGPMRRIEITVERHWVTRLVRGDDTEAVAREATGTAVGPVLPAPPDG